MGVQLQTRIYDPSTNEWSPGTNMTTARRDLAVAVLNDKIYALGGRVGVDMVLDANEIYDPDLNNWSDGAPLPTARSSHAVVVLDGKIHSIGGYDGNSILTDHDVYDPGANTWDPAAPLPAVNSVPSSQPESSLERFTLFSTPERFLNSIHPKTTGKKKRVGPPKTEI